MRTRKSIPLLAAVFIIAYVLASGLQSSSQTTQEVQPALSAVQLFKERGCEHCHVLNGVGGHKGPNLSDVGRRMSAAAIDKQIREGGGAMPPYADAIDSSEITKLTEMLSRARSRK